MTKLPTGVEIRNGHICIWFIFRGARRREVLKGWGNTPSNIKKAGNLRAVITGEINLGTFDYQFRFPTSKNAKKFCGKLRISSFKELTTEWLKNKKSEISADTFQKTCSKIKTLESIIGEDTLISSLSLSDILDCRNELLHGETKYILKKRKNRKGRSPKTVDNYISTLCSMLKYAYLAKHITEKPFEGVRKLKKSRTKPDPLSKNEALKLLDTLTGQKKHLWKTALYTGLRHGELCALSWDDIDFKKGTLHVRRNLTSIGNFGPPKTNAGIRIITLLNPALDALKEQYKLTGSFDKREITYHYREFGKTEKQNRNFVFVPQNAHRRDKFYYSTACIGQIWNKAISAAEIKIRNPYQSRHTYACWLLTAGANPSFIASQMGHENAQMVYEVYGAWMEEMNKDQIGLLNAKLAS
ncbi:Integrase [Serratia quinivorans]|uniref:site-specific integrase n=1 Tax=Serratia quinivorans TaxID=137545 RepID=UPI00217AE1A6|nr:site-specific integrase [Serratia quinivorans]CAI1503493.1 Integrase [Serratia quinivorans]